MHKYHDKLMKSKQTHVEYKPDNPAEIRPYNIFY